VVGAVFLGCGLCGGGRGFWGWVKEMISFLELRKVGGAR